MWFSPVNNFFLKAPIKSKTALPDGTKKTINQSIGYGKYVISGTADMATHKLDMAMPYELSQWELIKKEDGSYDLIKAHVDKNGIASFDIRFAKDSRL